jgi:hypothetical protein
MRIPGMLELCFAIMVMAAVSSFTSSAQSVELEDDSSFYSSGSCPLNASETADYATDETVDVDIQRWLGSAVKGDESHILRLNLESIRSVDPSQARDLLASNTSLEEIKSKMRSEERFVIMRGSIRIDNDIFKLTNITTTSLGNGSVMDADVVGPVAGPRFRSGSGNSAYFAGKISATLSIVDEIGMGAGTLTMNGPDYSGAYELSLSYPSAGQCARSRQTGPSQRR